MSETKEKSIKNKVKSKKEEENSKLLLWKNIKRTMSLYWEIDKKGLLLFICILTFAAIIPFVTSYLFGQLYNLFVDYLANKPVTRESILTTFGLAAALGVLESLLWSLSTYLDRRTYLNWHEKMSILVPARLSSLDLEIYESNKHSNFINKIQQGYSFKPAEFASKLLWSIYNSVQLLAASVVLFSLSPIIMPLILISLMPGLFVQMGASKLGWGIWDSKGDVGRLNSFTAWYLSQADSLKEIRIYGLRNYFLELIKKWFGEFQNEQRQILNKTQYKLVFVGLFEAVIFIGIELWMILRILNRTAGFSIGNFTFYTSAITKFTDAGRNLMFNVVKMYEGNLYMSDFFKLMDMENRIVTPENAIPVSSKKTPLIEFRNVAFKYPNTKTYIYKDFSIVINPGEDIALVGENGAGKTTFVKLLLRFYDVDEGEILVNGINIKDINLEDYYKNIGVLFQDFNQYIYSVRENIFAGDVSRENDLEKIINASKDAGADEFVQKYKKKYDQMLSKQFKNGIKPSGGQWQRIALARAFFRNANILILDEPTSAIDAKGEYEIFKRIAEVQKEKTTIIISHRFSTVKKADTIYVIDEGKILEKGKHEELMKLKKGKYKEMFELQAEGYK